MHKGFNLKAVLERNNKKAKEYYPNVISYDKIEEIVGDEEIKLIIVNTPNFLHYEHARSALLAGYDYRLTIGRFILSGQATR